MRTHDKNVDIELLNSQELAEYAFEQISHSASLSNLLGY